MITECFKCLPNKSFQPLRFMSKFIKNKTLVIFNNLIKKPFHEYPTKFSKKIFSFKMFFLNGSKYCISFRRRKVWKDFLTNQEREINPYLLFSKSIKVNWYLTRTKTRTKTFFKIYIHLKYCNFLNGSKNYLFNLLYENHQDVYQILALFI